MNRSNIRSIAEEKKKQGNDQYKAQNYQAALKLYSDAISLCPDSAAFYGNRAACHMMLCNYHNALSDARTAVRIDPKFEKGYVRIAKCCTILGDIIGTEQAIKKLEEVDPLNSAIKIEQQSCQQLRQIEKTVQTQYESQSYRNVVYYLDNALKIAPACLKYKLMKAECLAFLGRTDEAVDIAVSVMKNDTTSADAIYVRGLCLYYSDNLEKGILHFERALQLDPDHQKAKTMRFKSKLLKEKKESGNVLFKSGRFREALTVYTDALEIDPFNKDMNSKLYYNRALVNSKIGSLREAIVDCTKVLEINSNYLKALLLRARCNNDLEKFEECVADYEAAFQIQKTNDIKNMLRDAKFALKKSKRKDYYKILGVNKNSTEDEIKKAYRKKALVHHPDRHANSTAEERKIEELKFKEIGEAYAILSDSRKKMRYDSGQDIDEQEQGGSNGFSFETDEDDTDEDEPKESDSLFSYESEEFSPKRRRTEFDPNQMFRQFFQFSGGNGASFGFDF
ncbi:dnaJ homolog subfamily C member 7 isoform X3 [Episyrphus balteatus]|uniref:dnaJ homolog subfamily C member 7 isoform X3 n=1 Tax=Episyrphus balteatus TaxID=286459 RepID=UPI002485C382|nr:dnaJ homolog subfamily C member 7 isoform X3 [Episyrphus balteatus]